MIEQGRISDLGVIGAVHVILLLRTSPRPKEQI